MGGGAAAGGGGGGGGGTTFGDPEAIVPGYKQEAERRKLVVLINSSRSQSVVKTSSHITPGGGEGMLDINALPNARQHPISRQPFLRVAASRANDD